MNIKWFKLLWLNSEERRILKEAEKAKNTPDPVDNKIQDNYEDKKPYRKIIYDGYSIQVIFKDGCVYSKYPVKESVFREVRDAKTEKDIYRALNIFDEKEGLEEINNHREKESIRLNSDIFEKSNDFEKVNGAIFMKGISLELPYIVAASFIEILERIEIAQGKELEKLNEAYYALKMFWLQLALNPLEQSRQDLLLFVKKNDVHITKNGNLILYRRIVSYKNNTDKEFTAFISQKYFDRKRQKKSYTHPRNYYVYRLNLDNSLLLWNIDDDIPDGELLGNLEELYKNLENHEGNTYTSWHNNGKLKIKIGGVYKISDNDINLDNNLCSAGGLHAAAVDYDYTGFGDTPVVVLVNPSKAITVPTDDWKKLRTTEMFIAAVNDKPHGVHYDDNDLSVFDEEYYNISMAELEKSLANKDFTPLFIKNEAPDVKIDEIMKISQMLKERVKSII